MEQGSETEIDALLSEQAAGWFVRLVANDLSPRERREYLAWLKASDRHVEALLGQDTDQQAADVRVILDDNGTADFGGRDHRSTSTVLTPTGHVAALYTGCQASAAGSGSCGNHWTCLPGH